MRDLNRIALRLAASLAVTVSDPASAAPADEAANAFAAQIAAWNRGDLDGALAAYWDSPKMTWVSRRGVEKGLKPFADAMRSDFSGKPGSMGVYQGQVLERRSVSPDKALLVIRWSIHRGDTRLMGGVSTQYWRKMNRRWVITLEHAS